MTDTETAFVPQLPPAEVRPVSRLDPTSLSEREALASAPSLSGISSSVIRFVFHHARLYGWVPTAAWMLKHRPGQFLLVFYCLARRSNLWRSIVHKTASYGLKDSPARLESRLSAPLQPASEKRYLISIHPHGLLCDGWHIVMAKHPDAFLPDNNQTCGIPNFKPHLCFSPVIQYVPAHQEMYRERCGGASSSDVQRVLKTSDCIPSVCPGGFAEAVFCASGKEKQEYSWLEGNMGFIAMAIKNKTDIIPSYTYGLTSMYRTIPFLRQQLAEVAQNIKFPLVLFWGKFLALPLHEDVVTVLYDPFPVQKYSIDDVEQAHRDYKDYLRRCFDQDKGKYGMGDKELCFVGPRNLKGKKKYNQGQSKL